MKDEFLDYINDILDAMTKAESFIVDYDFEIFSRDWKTIFAVIRALEIIGEATKKIPENIRANYSNIPWKSIAGIRDKLIHGYDNIDLNLVWETVDQQIPYLKHQFQKILKDFASK